MKNKFILGISSFLFAMLFLASSARAATITVTEKNDSFNMGNCSLRDAIESVNQGSNQGGCNFTGGFGDNDNIILEAGTYTLSLPSSGAGDNTDGPLSIKKPLVIRGAGANSTNVTGGFPVGQEDRIFNVCFNLSCNSNPSDTTVVISDLTVSNGGSLTGSISGGGIYVSEPFQPASEVRLELQNCQILANASGLSSGGGIYNDGADLLIERCAVTGNSAYYAGGIHNGNGLTVINESTIDNNDAVFFDGGGIYGNGIILLYNSTVSNNRALSAEDSFSSGGGIYVTQICNSNLVVVNSTISGNRANVRGGGVFIEACNDDTIRFLKLGTNGGQSGAFFFNSTIAFNQAMGIVDNPGVGGGIYFDPSNIRAAGVPGANSVGLYNTILAQNTAEQGPDCYSALDSGGFNLFGNDSDCSINPSLGKPDQLNIDPLLGPLQDNGGPTQTHGLLDNSPAIDMGNNLPDEGCQAIEMDEVLQNNYSFFPLTRDQRDFMRPIAVLDPNHSICDVGAFEFQVFDFLVTKDDGQDGASIAVGEGFTYTISITNNGPGTATAVILEDPLPGGITFGSVNPSQGTCTGGAVVSCELGDLAQGQAATVVVAVTAAETGDWTNIVTVTLNNPFQEQISQTAQVITSVGGGGLLEGSGFNCGLMRGEMEAGPKTGTLWHLMTWAMLGAYALLRHRGKGRTV